MKITHDNRGGYLELIKVAYPLIFMSASNMIMQFADRKFLSLSSTEEMAAALPSGVLYFTLFVFFTATCGYTSSLVAQWYGKGNQKECVRSVWAGLWMAAGASILIVTLIPWICLQILQWTMTETLFPLGKSYVCGLIPSGAIMCLTMPLFAFFSGRGKTAVVAGINIFICVANIFLNWLLIFGNWGFQMGDFRRRRGHQYQRFFRASGGGDPLLELQSEKISHPPAPEIQFTESRQTAEIRLSGRLADFK